MHLSRNVWAKCLLLTINFTLMANFCYATTYYYPAGNQTGAVAPQTLASSDTLNINSGTFQTTNSTAFTVNLLGDATINTLYGSTISYAGSNTGGAALYSSTANAANVQTINIRGTVSAGTGSYASYFKNTNTGNSDSVKMNLYPGSIINGNFTSLGISDFSTYITGTPQINGNITGTSIGTAPEYANVISGQFNVGYDSAGTVYPGSSFTSQGTINYSIVGIENGSTLTLNHNCTILQVQSGTASNRFIVNQALTATNIILNVNNSSLTLAANLNMKPYSGSQPVIDIYNIFVTRPIYVTTTNAFNYISVSNMYTSVMNDQLNYGQLNLRMNSATLFQISGVSVSYTGGYLAGGSYVIYTSDLPNSVTPTIGNLPANTMFLSFGSPLVRPNEISLTIMRTPFQAIATNTTAQDIGTSLEFIGSNNPNASNMLVLNNLQTSRNSEQLNNNLLQLAPLAGASTQSLNVQNLSIRQPMTRLSEPRGYGAGEYYPDKNVWIRPFGDSVTQHTINNINGYSANTAGVAIGLDKEFGYENTLGIAASYAYSSIKDKIHSDSHTYLNSYQGMLYGSMMGLWNDDSIYWDWLGAVAHNTYSSVRNINLPALSLKAGADYNNMNYSALTVLGKIYETKKCARIMPELSAQYTLMSRYSYKESGAPGANLNINKSDANVIQLGAWLRTTSLARINIGELIPEAHIAGLYNVINTNRNLGFQFLDGGGQILNNMGPNNGAARIGCGLTLVTNSLDLKFNFDVELQNEYTDYSAYLNLSYLF